MRVKITYRDTSHTISDEYFSFICWQQYFTTKNLQSMCLWGLCESEIQRHSAYHFALTFPLVSISSSWMVFLSNSFPLFSAFSRREKLLATLVFLPRLGKDLWCFSRVDVCAAKGNSLRCTSTGLIYLFVAYCYARKARVIKWDREAW